jgi:hypothetical protein
MCTRYVPFCRALIDLFVIVCCSWFFCVREHAAGSFLQGVDCLVRNCVLFFGFSMSENMLPVAIQLPRKDNIFGNPWQNLRLPSQD